MVRKLDWWRERQNSSISVVQQRKEHPLQECTGVDQRGVGEEIDDVALVDILDEKLGGNTLDACSEGARGSGY